MKQPTHFGAFNFLHFYGCTSSGNVDISQVGWDPCAPDICEDMNRQEDRPPDLQDL